MTLTMQQRRWYRRRQTRMRKRAKTRAFYDDLARQHPDWSIDVWFAAHHLFALDQYRRPER